MREDLYAKRKRKKNKKKQIKVEIVGVLAEDIGSSSGEE